MARTMTMMVALRVGAQREGIARSHMHAELWEFGRYLAVSDVGRRREVVRVLKAPLS